MLPKELFNADTMLERLLPWVREESPTYHVAGVNRMMDLVSADLAKLGGTKEGVLRSERITWTGYVRDTGLWSLLADEWSAQ